LRLSEKTIELNFCAEFAHICGQHGLDLRWFGLTQKQEARLAFDAAAKMQGRIIYFQFKAMVDSDFNICKFNAPHEQMQRLRRYADKRNNIFYVLPNIGTTFEFLPPISITKNCRYLQVHNLPNPIPLPIGKRGKVLKNKVHLVEMNRKTYDLIIHSEPFTCNTISTNELIDVIINSDKYNREKITENSFDDWWAEGRPITNSLIGVVVTNADKSSKKTN